MANDPTAFDGINIINDGEYGTELGRVSPEGNVYGQTRLVKSWIHHKWWTGEEYTDVEIAGRADSFAELPTDRPWGEVWQIPDAARSNGWGEYWYNAEDEEWVKLKWFWTVYGLNSLPYPGVKIGAAHKIKESNVNTIWNGYTWERHPKHSGLLDDEPERHLPSGFLQMVAPDVRVTYYSPKEVGLRAVEGGSGKVWVKGTWIAAGRSCSVFNRQDVINFNSQTKSLSFAPVDPETEYWIYLANNDENFSTAAWDYREKMFLSLTPNIDGYLSDEGSGKNARLVGRVETDAESKFVPIVDMSLVSNTVNFPETYRDYSDYQVQFVDENTLALKKLDGQYGQIAIGRDLYYLGIDYDIDRGDPWVDWNDSDVQMDGVALDSDSIYYIYISSRIDAFNFNPINELTGRPWEPTDQNSEYLAALDLRLRPFLSPKEPEHGRMADRYPGYECRHIGIVRTDGNGKFINARDLSSIRQPQLNPTYFDGLAEIVTTPVNSDEFRICRKIGTSGIVNVAGDAVQSYAYDDPNVYKITTISDVYSYSEGEIGCPVTPSQQVIDYPSSILHLYLANSNPLWGAVSSSCFFTMSPPQNGYLSRNWSGNQARWIAKIQTDANGQFTGSFIQDSVAPLAPYIDDGLPTLNTVWSAAKVSSEISKVLLQLNASAAYGRQKTTGIPWTLNRNHAHDVKLIPSTPDLQFILPDLSLQDVPNEGISKTLEDEINCHVFNNAMFGIYWQGAQWDCGEASFLSGYSDYYLQSYSFYRLSRTPTEANPWIVSVTFNERVCLNVLEWTSAELDYALYFPKDYTIYGSNLSQPDRNNDSHWVEIAEITSGIGPQSYNATHSLKNRWENSKIYLHYRFRITATNSPGYCVIKSAKCWEPTGTFATMMADGDAGQTVTATSTSFSYYPPRYALAKPGSLWQSQGNPNSAKQCIMFTKGIPVAYRSLGFMGDTGHRQLVDFKIWGSNVANPNVDTDGDFVLLRDVVNFDWTLSAGHYYRFVDFINATKYLWYRVSITENNGYVAEMSQVAWVPSDANIRTYSSWDTQDAPSASATSTSPGYNPAHAFAYDSLYATKSQAGYCWASNAVPTSMNPQHLAMNYMGPALQGRSVTVASVWLQARTYNGSYATRGFPKEVEVFGSNADFPSLSNEEQWTSIVPRQTIIDPGDGGWVKLDNPIRSYATWQNIRLTFTGSYATASVIVNAVKIEPVRGNNIFIEDDLELHEHAYDPQEKYAALEVYDNSILVGNTA